MLLGSPNVTQKYSTMSPSLKPIFWVKRSKVTSHETLLAWVFAFLRVLTSSSLLICHGCTWQIMITTRKLVTSLTMVPVSYMHVQPTNHQNPNTFIQHFVLQANIGTQTQTKDVYISCKQCEIVNILKDIADFVVWCQRSLLNSNSIVRIRITVN